MTRIAIKFISLSAIAAVTSYLIFAPVDIEPVAWQAPESPGLTGVYAQNQTLSQIQRIALNGGEGPEDLAVDVQGHVYFSLLTGDIQKIDAQGKITQFANTGGRPLGIEFDTQGNLLVADAFRGLLSIDPQGQINHCHNTHWKDINDFLKFIHANAS